MIHYITKSRKNMLSSQLSSLGRSQDDLSSQDETQGIT